MAQQEQNLEKHFEKQMGCMAGFFQLFDRQQLLTGKRICSPKSLPATGSMSNSEIPTKSEPFKNEVQCIATTPDRSTSTTKAPKSPATTPKPVQPLSVFEFKESSTRSTTWKFREAPRLSLDSRATVDSKGSLKPKPIKTNQPGGYINDESSSNQRKSTSVVARLMGLEPIPSAVNQSKSVSPQLRRSASESRARRDLFDVVALENETYIQSRKPDPTRAAKVEPRRGSSGPHYPQPNHLQFQQLQQRKSFFDAADFFPEPKQTVSIYGEIDKRLKMRGIDEPSKDLETLKQILEALQLKGLLHSSYNKRRFENVNYSNNKRRFENVNNNNNRNFIIEPSSAPIVVMRPAKSPVRSRGNAERNNVQATSPRSNLSGPNARSPTRSERSNGIQRRKMLSVETNTGRNDSAEQRRVSSPVHSPKVGVPRGRNANNVADRSPRIKKPKAEIHPKEKVDDELSESGFSTSSERTKEGRSSSGSILERCDKLLHSIEEMNATAAEVQSSQQPSPVSVLDSSFYKDESSSPSPVMKRSIDFQDLPLDFDDELLWSPSISIVESVHEVESHDPDFIYVSDIVRANSYLPQDADVFLLLEKQQCLRGKDTSKVSMLQRRLIFDTVIEISECSRRMPPWKLAARSDSSPKLSSLQHIWSEFKRIRERDESEDVLEVICGVLKKDLACDGTNGWGERHAEFSDAVLDMERLIFKDLIGETIQDLASITGKDSMPRRKLVF